MKPIALLSAVMLCACTGASHIPPPWELPGAAVGTVIENAAYGVKRNKVKTFIGENREILFEQVRSGTGPTLTRAFQLAGVSPEGRAKLPGAILGNPEIYSDGPPEKTLENLAVTFMVYGK